MSQPDSGKLNNKDLNEAYTVDKTKEKKTISQVDSSSQLNGNSTKQMNMSMRSTSNSKC
jgi:hypothetical protein